MKRLPRWDHPKFKSKKYEAARKFEERLTFATRRDMRNHGKDHVLLQKHHKWIKDVDLDILKERKELVNLNFKHGEKKNQKKLNSLHQQRGEIGKCTRQLSDLFGITIANQKEVNN